MSSTMSVNAIAIAACAATLAGCTEGPTSLEVNWTATQVHVIEDQPGAGVGGRTELVAASCHSLENAMIYAQREGYTMPLSFPVSCDDHRAVLDLPPGSYSAWIGIFADNGLLSAQSHVQRVDLTESAQRKIDLDFVVDGAFVRANWTVYDPTGAKLDCPGPTIQLRVYSELDVRDAPCTPGNPCFTTRLPCAPGRGISDPIPTRSRGTAQLSVLDADGATIVRSPEVPVSLPSGNDVTDQGFAVGIWPR